MKLFSFAFGNADVIILDVLDFVIYQGVLLYIHYRREIVGYSSSIYHYMTDAIPISLLGGYTISECS